MLDILSNILSLGVVVTLWMVVHEVNSSGFRHRKMIGACFGAMSLAMIFTAGARVMHNDALLEYGIIASKIAALSAYYFTLLQIHEMKGDGNGKGA